MFYSINSDNYIMDTTKLLVKIGKKNLGKIGSLDNQKLELKFLGTKIRIPEKFWFGYSSPFYRPEISDTRIKTSFGSATRTMNTPTSTYFNQFQPISTHLVLFVGNSYFTYFNLLQPI